MNPFSRQDGELLADSVRLSDIANSVGTPVYVYSRSYFEARYRALQAALAPLDARICYAVKANSNLSVLRCFQALGAGFDIVSGGELQRVMAAGGSPETVVFSGVGKSEAEIDFALKLNIGCFNVESRQELDRLSQRASLLGRVAPVSVRVNPNVDAGTHPYISTGLKTNKFGVPVSEAETMYQRAGADPALEVIGIDCHIGSQIASAAPLLEALDSLLELVDRLNAQGIGLRHVDLGGGLGVRYKDEPDFDLETYSAALKKKLTGKRSAARPRTRSLSRRQWRRAADSRRVSEAGSRRRPQLCHCRRGDERPHPPRPVPGLARHRTRKSSRGTCPRRQLGHRRSGMRERRFPGT